MTLAATILTDAPIGYWKMNDTSLALAADSSGNSRNGAYAGATLLGCLGIDGLPGKSAKFAEPSNLGQLMSVPFDAAFVAPNITAEFCIQFQHFDFPTEFVFNAHGFSGPQIFLNSVGGGLGFVLKKQSNLIMASSTSTTITDTYLWHHVCITWDGITAHIYIDGVDTAGATTNQVLTSGGTSALQWAAVRLKAQMAHCAYYDKALTSDQVANHYAQFTNEVNYRATPGLLYGLHQNLGSASSDAVRLQQITMANNVHATVSRNDMRWDLIQTTSGGAYNWTTTDTVVSELAAEGITKCVFVVYLSPTWANGGAAITFVPGANSVDAAFTTWITKYQTFVTDMTNRYKAGEAGNPTGIDIYWEIWNEPNNVGFWTSGTTPQPNGTMYATLYKALRTSILAADPTAKTLFGSLVFWNNGGSSVTGQLFLKDALAVSGLSIDYASFHPYTDAGFGPDDVIATHNLLSDVLAFYNTLCSYGFSSARVLITEMGWHVADVGTEAIQAAYLTTTFARVRDYWSSFCTQLIWYRDWDSGTNTSGLWSTMPASPGIPTAKLSVAAFLLFSNSTPTTQIVYDMYVNARTGKIKYVERIVST